MATIAGTILAVAYVGLLGSFMIQMRWFDGPYHGLIPLAFLVATAKGADTGAYTLGPIAGRHKLWPTLSPNKTIEGAVGGLVFGGVRRRSSSRRSPGSCSAVPTLGWWPSRSASAPGRRLRRPARRPDGVDDQARLRAQGRLGRVPGFGGVLDVLDSLLFAGPVAYIFWVSVGP